MTYQCVPTEVRCGPSAGGTARRSTVTVQRPAEQSFSQQFVRPHQLLEGKVKTLSCGISQLDVKTGHMFPSAAQCERMCLFFVCVEGRRGHLPVAERVPAGAIYWELH